MDSKECLEHAQACMEDAGRGKSEGAQAEFLRLAEAWMQLAVEIDGLQDEIACHQPQERRAV
jgi:hypothetical protein